MGGVFLAFSIIVMPALSRVPAAQGVAAMQSVNVVAVRPGFLTALFGTAAACLPLAVAGVRAWGGGTAGLLLTGSGLYLLGAVGVTVAHSVPRNDALAALDAGTAEAARYWAAYLREWTGANSVRAVAALAAAAAFAVAARS